MSFWSNSVATDLTNLKLAVPKSKSEATDSNFEIIINRLFAYAKLKKDHSEAALATALFLKRADKTTEEKNTRLYCLLSHLDSKNSRRLLPYLNDVISMPNNVLLTEKAKKEFQDDMQKWSTGIWHRKGLRAGYNKVLEFYADITSSQEVLSIDEKAFNMFQKIAAYYQNTVVGDHARSLTYLNDLRASFDIPTTLAAYKQLLEERSSDRLLKWIELGEKLLFPNAAENYPASKNKTYIHLMSMLTHAEQLAADNMHARSLMSR